MPWRGQCTPAVVVLLLCALGTVPPASGDLPQCPTTYDSCIAERVGITFADAWRSVGLGEPLKNAASRGAMCRRQSWVDLASCQTDPILQFEITEPQRWRGARLMLAESHYTPWVPEAHIDPSHPLHGKEVDLTALGVYGTSDATGCTEAAYNATDVAGKVVILFRWECGHIPPVMNAQEHGAAAVLYVLPTLTWEMQAQLVTYIASNKPPSVKTIPMFSTPTAGGQQVMSYAARGGRVRGRFLVKCGGTPATAPQHEYFDSCGTAEWSTVDMGGCGTAAAPEDRVCTGCPATVTFEATGAKGCLYSNYLTPFRYKNNLLNHTRSGDTLALAPGDVVYFGGRLRSFGCSPADYMGYTGKVVVVPVRHCHLYAAAYAAQQAGVRAFWMLGAPNEKTTQVLSGSSSFIDIPVHSVGTDMVLAFLQAAEVHAKDLQGHTPIAEGVHLALGELPPYVPPNASASGAFTIPAAAPESKDEFSRAYAVACGVLILVLVIAFVHRAVVLVRETRFEDAWIALGDTRMQTHAARATMPLGLLSTTLALTILVGVITVTFALVNNAGSQSIESAVADGEAQVDTLHRAAMVGTRDLNTRWIELLGKTMLSRLHNFFAEPIMMGLLLSKRFSGVNETWAAFEERLDMVRAHGTSSEWKPTVRMTNGFYAKVAGGRERPGGVRPFFINNPDEVLPGGMTTATSSDGWGGTELLVRDLRTDGTVVPPSQPVVPYELYPIRRQIGGETLVKEDYANDVVRGLFTPDVKRPLGWYISRVAYDTRRMHGFALPISLLLPVYTTQDYRGSVELSRDIDDLRDSFRELLAGTESTENITAMLTTEDGTMLYIHTRHGRTRHEVLDIFQYIHQKGYGYYTADDVFKPELNAYMHYYEASLKNLQRDQSDDDIPLSATFDQADHYRERSPWVVYSSIVADGAVRNVDGSSDYFSNCTAATACVGVAEGPGDAAPREVVALDGSGHVRLSYNLSQDSALALRARTSPAGAPYTSDWELFNGSTIRLENGRLGFDFADGLVKHAAVVHMSHTVAMWVRPTSPVNTTIGAGMPILFTDSLLSYHVRFYANGALRVGSLSYGCATPPVAGGLPEGVWTHMAYSMSVEDRTCRTYVNGTLHAASQITLNFLGSLKFETSYEPYRVGMGFRGHMDAVQVLNTSVPDGQLAGVMRTGRFTWRVPSRRWLSVRHSTAIEGTPPLRLALTVLIPEEDVLRRVNNENAAARLNLDVLSGNTKAGWARRRSDALFVVFVTGLAAMLGFLVTNAELLAPMSMITKQLVDVSQFRVGEDAELDAATHVTEFAIVKGAMGVMVANMRVFKSFMPRSLGLDEDGADEHNEERDVTIVFTDIRSSTVLWERCTHAMAEALATHNAIIRRRIDEFDGLEVKTIGDAFMIAFSEPGAACRCAMRVQEDLLRAEWPEDLLAVSQAARTPDGAYSGIKIRVGVNCGVAKMRTDGGRIDYFGPCVNTAARVEAACIPGAVCVTAAVLAQVALSDLGGPTAVPMGPTMLKGVAEPVELTLLLPQALAARVPDVQAQVKKLQGEQVRALAFERQPSSLSTDSIEPVHGATPSAFTLTVPGWGQMKRNIMLQCAARLERRAQALAKTTFARTGEGYDLGCSAHSEGVLDFVNATLAAVMAAARQTDGVALSVFGASVYIVWPSPCPHDHLRQAQQYTAQLDATLRDGTVAYTGVSSGLALYGNVGANAQRFSTVVGGMTRMVSLLEEACVELDASALYASLMPDATLAMRPGPVCIRPVDRWEVRDGQSESRWITVYQMCPTARVAGDLGSIAALQQPGWDSTYWAAFDAHSVDDMPDGAGDPVLQRVRQMLVDGTHLRAPLGPRHGVQQHVESLTAVTPLLVRPFSSAGSGSGVGNPLLQRPQGESILVESMGASPRAMEVGPNTGEPL